MFSLCTMRMLAMWGRLMQEPDDLIPTSSSLRQSCTLQQGNMGEGVWCVYLSMPLDIPIWHGAFRLYICITGCQLQSGAGKTKHLYSIPDFEAQYFNMEQSHFCWWHHYKRIVFSRNSNIGSVIVKIFQRRHGLCQFVKNVWRYCEIGWS